MAATGSLAAKQMGKMGKSSEKMTALEVTTLGKQLASGKGAMVSLMMDPADPDWQGGMRRAKSTRTGNIFASRVNFTLAGTPFVGRVGYSVKGGVVPLFDGAALDLNGTSLTAEDPKKVTVPDPFLGSPAVHKNWVVGSGGLLVLAPVGADNVVPAVTEHVVVTERGLSARAVKSMSFQQGKREIRAEEVTVSDQVALLKGLQVTEDGEDRTADYMDQAVVTGAGIGLLPASARPSGIQEKEPAKAGKKLEQIVEAVVSHTGSSEEVRMGSAKEDPETESQGQRVGIGVRFDPDSMSVEAGNNSELSSSEEDPLWTQVLDALKNHATKRVKELLLEVVTTGKTEKFMGNLKSDVGDKWEQLKAVYDGFSNEELRESWAAFPKAARDFFHEKLSEKDVEEYMKKLIPTGPLTEFLGLKENEEKESDASKDKWKEIPLVKIPLFPGIDFSVTLEPAYQLSTFILGGAHNMKALWDAEEEEDTNLEFSAGVRGSLSLTAAASLMIGIPLIIQGYGSLYAEAALEGAAEAPEGNTRMFGAAGGTPGIALVASGKLPVRRMKDGSIKQVEDAEVSLEGGLDLKGSVGIDAGIRSSVLMWKKSLFEKTLAEWDLLTIGACLKVSKAPSDSFFSGWNLDEASINVDTTGFLDSFLEKNTAERRYGLYKPEEVESGRYENLQEDFQSVLHLLEDFKTIYSSGETLLISKEEGESGLQDTLGSMGEQLQNIQNAAVSVWVDTQNELEYMERVLEERKNSVYMSKQKTSSESSRSVHEQRLEYMEQWQEDSGKNVMDYYKEHGSKPGSGFENYMYTKDQESHRTYEGIVAYEREQYVKKTKKHFDRIRTLEALTAEQKSDEEVWKAYKKEMKGSRAAGSRASLVGTQALLDYEYGRYTEVTKDARKRRSEAMKIMAGEDPVKAYAEKYLGRGGAGKLEGRDVYWLGNAKLLLEYEAKKVISGKGADKKDLEILGASDAAMEILGNSPGEADLGRLTEQLRKAMNSQSGGSKDGRIPQLTELFGDEIYKTATLDDLLQVELKKRIWGDEGQKLDQYLAQKPARTTGQAQKGDKSGIFGKMGVANALTRMGTYLDTLDTDRLASGLTLEILLDYAQRRSEKLKKTKDINAQKQVAMAIRYLRRGQTKLEAAPGEKKAEVQAEYIAGYFKMYENMERQYRESLKKGEELNLPLMQEAFSDGSADPVYQQLLAMKESGTPDFKALTSYLALTGGKKEILEAIRENQREKFAQTPPDLMDIRRFYEARLAERTQKKDGVAGHYDRYARLRIMTDSGASYEELLAAYEEMGAGNGYKEFLLKSIKDGQIDGRQVTREDLMELEGRRVDRIGEKHLTRIDLIHQVQDQEGSYEEIYGRYMAQVEQDDPGLWKTIKNTIGKESRFERTMNKKDSGADELIAYEKMRAEEVGLKHADRLRVLLGLSDGAEDFMDAGLLQDPIVKEAKRKDYLEKSKRFKKMDQEGDLSFKDFAKQLRERQGSVLRAEILNYEKGRKQEYEARLAEIEKADQEIHRMREELKEQTAKCHALTNAITNIKGNPESVWKELERFEETVIFLDEHKDPEAEARRTEQETEKARSRADAAIRQMDELRARKEEE